MLTETPIITGVLDDDVFGRNIVPQMRDAPPHRKLRMRTVQGPLLLRIADDATPNLVESLLAPKSGVDFSVPLRGSGPFNLPIVQSAKAYPGNDAVLLVFRVLAEPDRMVTVQIEIPNGQALKFAATIAHAVPSK